MDQAYIGRQPIFDKELHTFGYELLFRSGGSKESAGVIDGNAATSQVMVNTFLEIGIENIVGTGYAFFNLTHEFLTGEIPIPFNPGKIVLEVLEDILMSDQVIASVKRLSDQGFLIALDDFVFGSEQEQLIPFADIIKVEFPAHSKLQLENGIRKLARSKKRSARILAEKIETEQEYQLCRSLGFDLYQGYFFSKPRVFTSAIISENNLEALLILKKLQDPNMVLKDLEELIMHDVSLTYKILRYINSANFSFQHKIESIAQAVTLLGLDTIKQWVMVLLFAKGNTKPDELIRLALIRSKMCHFTAKLLHLSSLDKYTIVGLFSLIDSMMECPMATILEQLPLEQDINEALLNRTGEIGEILSFVIAYEEHRVEELAQFYQSKPAGVAVAMQRGFIEAVRWSRDIIDA